MAERSKALRSGRSLVLQAWVRIPLLTNVFFMCVQFATVLGFCSNYTHLIGNILSDKRYLLYTI